MALHRHANGVHVSSFLFFSVSVASWGRQVWNHYPAPQTSSAITTTVETWLNVDSVTPYCMFCRTVPSCLYNISVLTKLRWQRDEMLSYCVLQSGFRLIDANFRSLISDFCQSDWLYWITWRKINIWVFLYWWYSCFELCHFFNVKYNRFFLKKIK